MHNRNYLCTPLQVIRELRIKFKILLALKSFTVLAHGTRESALSSILNLPTYYNLSLFIIY